TFLRESGSYVLASCAFTKLKNHKCPIHITPAARCVQRKMTFSHSFMESPGWCETTARTLPSADRSVERRTARGSGGSASPRRQRCGLLAERQIDGALLAVAHRHGLLDAAERFLPRLDDERPAGEAGQCVAPVGARHREERMAHDPEPGAHPRVHVAGDGDHHLRFRELALDLH